MANRYYCKYCGVSHSSVQSITAGMCSRHPSGSHKGRHAPYEGSSKSKYICKYCGTSHSSINSLTAGMCGKHSKGPHKGRHEPML